MASNAQFDLSILSAVKPAVDGALAGISGHLEQYLDTPDKHVASLEAARRELHRLTGVLKMIRLDGVATFCTELEMVLSGLAANPQQLSGMHRDALRHALSGVTHYLDALADGADNAVLRLFPQYQELQQLRGLEMAFELDLFYPNLEVPLPQALLGKHPQDDAKTQLKILRSQYQQGLMRWLRQDEVSTALQLMQQTIEAVMYCVPQDSGRAFWWIANGLLDCLKFDGLPPELSARKLLGRIDQQMRAVAENHAGDVQPILSEMLYLIGRSHTVSDLVETIKQAYALDRYLPKPTALPQSEIAQRLSNMRNQLRVAEEAWSQCVQGDKAACEKFIECACQLASQNEKLDRNALSYLTKQIQSLSGSAREPARAQLMAGDMAMALLLLDDGIEHYNSLGNGFQEQARILSERMSAAVQQQPEQAQSLADLVELHCQMEQEHVMVHLAKEMLANLQHVEQGLNAFFSDAAKRDELPGLLRLLNQIHGVFHIALLEQAEQLLVSIQRNVRRFAQGNDMPKPRESHALANAVGALESYLQHRAHGQAGEVAPLQAALTAVGKLQKTSAQNADATAEQAPASAAVQRPIGEDQELLEVFLEEAQEVLQIMRNNLEICQLHPDSIEPLVTIRRGFHTLKGSGRMVGLTDLGEVAWCIERAMNNWLQDNKPATPALLHFINMATQSFTGWVDTLNQQGGVRIEADDLIVAARQIGGCGDLEAEQIVSNADSTTGKSGSELPDFITPDTQDAQEFPHDIEMHAPSAPAMNTPSETLPWDDLAAVYENHSEVFGNGSQPVPEIPAEPVITSAPAAEDGVVIGEIMLTMPLFNIASEEARQNVAVLQQQFEVLRTSVPSGVQYDFMRAAHTLAGVNRSMGFADVVELASALEAWLQERIGKVFTPSENQLALLEQAIAALEKMSQSICDKQMPQARPDLAGQLVADSSCPGGDVAAEQAVEGQIIGEQPQLEAFTTAPVEQPEKSVNTEKPQVQDDVDEQLLPVFLEEADDLCPKIAESLRAWREHPEDGQQIQLLKRLLHTLKGSARMAGGMRIGEVVHEMEDRVLAATELRDQPGYWDELESDLDRIAALLEDMRSGKTKAPEMSSAEPRRRATDPPDTEHAAERRTPEMGAERALQGNLLRVRADVVDMLVNEAGEISMARARMETEMRAFKESMLEMAGSVARMKKQLREMEIQAESQMQARAPLAEDATEQFDPLEFDRFTRLQELTRFMNESVHDVHTVQRSLQKNIDEINAAIAVQARINRELQERLMSVRLVPFSSINDRLYRVVRQTAKELNKRANLELNGTSMELDRSVLEKMTAPFEHLLRNTLVHGLEDVQTRSQAGKDPVGEICLNARQENNEIVFELSDDGAGLNFAALREKALARGLLQPDEAASDDQLAQMIFVSGISTATQVTEMAGRGIGMDVVRSEIAALGGSIEVNSTRGEGTRFTIRLPLTLAVMHALLVRAGDATYAIPSAMVEQMRQVKSAELEQLYVDRKIEWQGKTYPLHYLPNLLGDTGRAPENLPRNQILLLRNGELRMALHVEDLKGNREIVVKNVGPQLARMPGIAGATVLGDGVVVLILNPLQLLQRAGTTTVRKAEQAAPEVRQTKPLVMVVDDSLTVRKVTSRLLTRAGYQVVTARDGVDALEQLAEVSPSVMLLDVEMPRMDGFELTRHLRRDARTKDLPIIMITSRTADKHRDYALQLGVNAYMGKPYQEDELLREIASFLSEHKSQGSIG